MKLCGNRCRCSAADGSIQLDRGLRPRLNPMLPLRLIPHPPSFSSPSVSCPRRDFRLPSSQCTPRWATVKITKVHVLDSSILFPQGFTTAFVAACQLGR